MKILQGVQKGEIGDAVQSKLAMMIPVLEGTLFSLATVRVSRLGGRKKVTLVDLARESREGDGDVGICFEFAVHSAIAQKSEHIYDLSSEVLENFCKIKGGSESLLFGPEKQGRIPVLESVQNSLNDESRIHVGNQGQPPKLKRYIPQIINAYWRRDRQNQLPRSINGLWKADLFLGNHQVNKWVGVTVKSNGNALEAAKGLRIGIYPKKDDADTPRLDTKLNLIRLPLPYDLGFCELFYKSFFLTRAFLRADAQIPKPVDLPDAQDRFLTNELTKRREYPVIDVIEAIRRMSQTNLLDDSEIETFSPSAVISKETGLVKGPEADDPKFETPSLSPKPNVV